MKLGMFGSVLAAATVMTSGLAMAGPPNPIERAEDRKELREDVRETVGDRWDKARLEALLADYVKARKAKNVGAIKDLDARFMIEIRSEVRETKVETAEKAVELQDSKGERNGERKEVVKDVVLGHPVKAARDAHDLRDDRRDVRDDRRDLAAESASLTRKRQIRDDYVTHLDKFGPANLKAKEALIRKAIGEAKLEVRADVKEKVEDKRELREDRRDRVKPD